MILEGIVTTLTEDGAPHLTPVGAIVDREMTRLVLRPFVSSRTYLHLKRHGQGVFHVTDDVELLARAAVHQIGALPPLEPANAVDGVILADACRWYAFRVRRLEERDQRAWIECQVVDRGRLRDFFGFNRAKHAVVEAAILATRLALLPAVQVLGEFERLAVIVEKTAGDQEQRAFELLEAYVRERV